MDDKCVKSIIDSLKHASFVLTRFCIRHSHCSQCKENNNKCRVCDLLQKIDEAVTLLDA